MSEAGRATISRGATVGEKIGMLLLAVFSLSLAPSRAYDPVDMVFKNANIIPMTKNGTEGELTYRASVYVSGGVIKDIGEFEELEYPPGTAVLDCDGKYLVPGFADMHVHPASVDEAVLFLANGVTLIRDMWGNSEILAGKRAIHDRKMLGPEIFTTGPLLDGEGAYWPGSLIVTDPEKVPGLIDEMKDAGYDAVKVYDRLTLPVYDAIIKSARELGIPVVGHVPIRVGLVHALASGQKSIEHLSGYNPYGMPEKNIELTVESRVWLCPTLAVHYSLENMPLLQGKDIEEMKFVTPEKRKSWKNATIGRHGFAGYQKLTKTLYDRGANMVAGTDTGNPFVIAGFSLHDEFQYMHDAGLSPYQALLTATVNPAKMLGIEDRAGTIEKGKDANLVVLDGNPLADIKNTRAIAGVMARGFWLSEEDMRKLLDTVAAKNAR